MFFISALTHKLRSFLQLPIFVKVWLLPAWLLLGIAKLLIHSVSFSRMAPHLGMHMGTAVMLPLLTPQQYARALRIGRTVEVAARHTPWKSNCFAQAVAARLLLGLYRIPYTLCFGLMREPVSGEIQAHAWVAAGQAAVVGQFSFDRFTVVGAFTHLPPVQP